MDEAAKHNTLINDDFRGFEVIKNYQIEENVVGQYAQENIRFGKKKFTSQFVQGVVGGITMDVQLMPQLLIVIISGIMVLIWKSQYIISDSSHCSEQQCHRFYVHVY